MRQLIVMLVLVCACKEAPFERRDGGQDVPDCEVDPNASLCDEASQENVLFSYAEHVCALMLDCCTDAQRVRVAEQTLTQQGLALALIREPALLEDPTACRRAVTLTLFAKYQQSLQALDDERQHFNIEEARTCLSWLALGAQHCAPGLTLFDDANQPKSCSKLFGPNVEADGQCFEDADCVDAPDGGVSVCESRSAVFSDGGVRAAVDGRCRPMPGIADSCPLPQSTCAPGAYCAFDQRCRAKVAPGGVCAAAPCNDVGYCDTSKTPAVCNLRRSFYGPCSSSAECFVGLSCDLERHLCLPVLNVSPLDVQFDYCLGDQSNAVARALPFVPKDGGLD